MKGTKCIDTSRKAKMSKTEKQCLDCANNVSGFCRENNSWCYMFNKTVCNSKVHSEPATDKEDSLPPDPDVTIYEVESIVKEFKRHSS